MDNRNQPQNPNPGPGSPPIRFDAGRAWSRATALFKANRDTLMVLAGPFFLIPQMLMGMLMPEVPQGLEGEAAAEVAIAIFSTWWPLILGTALMQAAGVLAIMVLLADPARPTVRESIGAAIKALPGYVGATLILVAGVGLAALLILIPFAIAAGQGGTALATIPVIAAALWVNVRTLTLAPVVAVEQERNPFEALKRSWRLTVGNGGRILMLVALFLLAALVISVVATAVPGAILIAALGQDTARLIVRVIEAFVSSGLMLVWSVVLAATYRQLAG